MDNPAFQNDSGVPGRAPKKPLTRANTTLTPANKLWQLTQAPKSKLCRCNSVLVTKTCCSEEVKGQNSLNYPFFAKKVPAKNILTYNSVWSKNFWSDSFNRLHNTSPNFQKFPLPKTVATIYDPQFLTSKTSYSGSHPLYHHHRHEEPWPGGRLAWCWHPSCQKAAAIICVFVLTLLIMVLVGKPGSSSKKENWVDVILINGEFRITNELYRPSLSNSTSDDFQQLTDVISNQLDNLFSLSVLSEPYHSTAVTELSEGTGGGVGVHCQLVLRATTQLTATKVGLAFIGGLRNFHGHVWLGNFSVDIQSIGFQAGRDAVTWTGWSQWGPCLFMHEFGYVQLRSRNCTLRSGQYLHSTLPCLLVPNSQGNIETATCPAPTPTLLDLDVAESNVMERLTKITRVDCKNNTSIELIQNSVNTNVTTNTTTEQIFKNSSLPCRCEDDQVCVALQEHTTPLCHRILDTTDPTGCGGHCQVNTQVCQKIQDNAFRCVDDSRCLDDEWQCGNKLCIPLSKRCDGHFNCYDQTDEYNCDCNLTSHFQCGNRMSCLPLSKRCDAVVDCWDASDELNCTIHCMGEDQFTCNDSQCIPNHRFCDGFPDCKDHSDEPFGCSGECKAHEWRCRNARCIQQNKRCNTEDDCGDKSDETDCSTVKSE